MIIEIIIKGFNNSSGTFEEMCTCDCNCNCNCNCVTDDSTGFIYEEVQCAKKGKYDWGATCKRHTPTG
ncbi:hypothetical protein [Clostridium sp. Marseille-QA1073]